jgi:uncharacterized protein (DUF433 family)
MAGPSFDETTQDSTSIPAFRNAATGCTSRVIIGLLRPSQVGMLGGLRTLTCVHSVHTLEDMSSAYVSGRVPARYERLVTKQARAARTSKSDLVARYVIEKSLETEFPGISFRDSLSGREAYLTGHRVAVWEVLAVHEETKSIEKTASHFRWPRVLVKRALAYAKAFPEEIHTARDEETGTASTAR